VSAPVPEFASVAVAIPVRRLFTYLVPEPWAGRLDVGARVRVPFGPRSVEATVVAAGVPAPGPEIEVKPIDAVLAGPRRLGPDLVELARFVADYYLCSWGEALECALPPDPGPGAGVRAVEAAPGADLARLAPQARARRALLGALVTRGAPVPVAELTPAERGHARALVAAGLARRVVLPPGADGPAPRTPGVRAEPEPALPPTPGQAAVLGRLLPACEAGGYHPFLLFGATGSGKTEVYLAAARRTLEAGRSVLYLVPEIGLTPLLLARIRRRFPGQAVVLHSGLARRERFDAWDAARRGERRLVVGTRSAVFAPVPDLGLVVVDEEQDHSYKQSETPRYNGRDVAVVRAERAGAVIVLGSATPSMESFRHARAGRYELLRLGGRVEERPLPEVRIVDMRREFRAQRRVAPLSEALAAELRACLDRGDQALVLRNRRGWAAAVHCARCGGRVECPACSVTLTWHRAERRMRCHTCDFETRRPESCPHCGGEDLHDLGEGTERIEDVLRETLPGARIVRMDRDTVRRRGEHARVLQRFERGDIDVLVGTQMIAKGHDFPRVTLVGVLSADQSLGLADFRAAERAFQLLTQVAGRAGRGERAGGVVVQAFDAEHPVLHLAARQDYEAFYDREIVYRRALRYPPVAALVQIVIHDPDPVRTRTWAETMAETLRDLDREGRLLLSGPGPAPVERVRGHWRQRILVRSAGRRRLVDTVDRALAAVEDRVPRRALVVDVDPLSLR